MSLKQPLNFSKDGAIVELSMEVLNSSVVTSYCARLKCFINSIASPLTHLRILKIYPNLNKISLFNSYMDINQ